MMATPTVVAETCCASHRAGRGTLLTPHFSSMFWQKPKICDQHWITVVTKDNTSLFIICPRYYFKDGFVVFVKGEMRKTAENNRLN